MACTATATVTVGSGALSSASAANNGPLCSGGALDLTATLSGATTYSWSGPAGFTSTDMAPILPGTTTAAAGTYTLSATNACGTATATTTVIINTTPDVIASASAPALCPGLSVMLSASGAASYSWVAYGRPHLPCLYRYRRHYPGHLYCDWYRH